MSSKYNLLNCYLCFLIAALTISSTHCLSCKKSENGVIFLNHGQTISSGPFNCLQVTRPSRVTSKSFVKRDKSDSNICTVTQRFERSSPSHTYIQIDGPSHHLCRYDCRFDAKVSNEMKCITTINPNGKCKCVETKPDTTDRSRPRVVTVPIENSGDSDLSTTSTEGTDDCDGKPDGYEFADAVSCSSLDADTVHVAQKSENIRASVMRVKSLGNGLCTVVPAILEHKKRIYIKVPDDAGVLQACRRMCVLGSPICMTDITDGLCQCKTKIIEKLIPLDTETMKRRHHRYGVKCFKHGCGPCGACDFKNGKCKLKANARKKNLCPCGMICPKYIVREGKTKAMEIDCIRNPAMDCWSGRDSGKGILIPNLCKEGESDQSDECVCRKGYEEHIDEGHVVCKRITNKVESDR